MEQTHLILLAFLLLLPFSAFAQGPTIFDIKSYGAVPGGDITDALDKAWKAAIASPTPVKISIGPGSWTLKQAHLCGPSVAPVELENLGTVTALSDPTQIPNKEWEWITINYIAGFTLSGNGVFDGNGKQAWTMNDCDKNKNCMKLPINLSFNFINNSVIQDVTSKDSKNFHVNCIASHNVTFRRFKVSAPGNSPNTDGIHIARSTDVTITDSDFQTGDDCISMGDQISNIVIRNSHCGPGHGISIGSLGKNPEEKDVTGVTIQNCTFTNTDNGVRVKTWPSAPASLTISDLNFIDLTMNNVSNPVILDQEYCPYNLCDLKQASLIQISKVKIQNVKGTSDTQDVVTFACSSSKPCQDVQIEDVDLKFTGDPTLGGATTKCQNVKYTVNGATKLPPCKTTADPIKPVRKFQIEE